MEEEKELRFKLTVYDRLDILRSIKAIDVLCVISEYRDKLRRIDKSDLEFDIDIARDLLNETLLENNIDLDELLV